MTPDELSRERLRHKANFFQKNMSRARDHYAYLHDMRLRETSADKLHPQDGDPLDQVHFCPTGVRFTSSHFAFERSDGVYSRRDRVPRYACGHCCAALTNEWWLDNWRDWLSAHNQSTDPDPDPDPNPDPKKTDT